MKWIIYSWTGFSPACSATAGDQILAIAENETGERIVVRISPEYQNKVHISMTGRLEHEQTEKGQITTFVPVSEDV